MASRFGPFDFSDDGQDGPEVPLVRRVWREAIVRDLLGRRLLVPAVLFAALFAPMGGVGACGREPLPTAEWRAWLARWQRPTVFDDVTATAYNSVRAQTDSTPSIAAWGDRLRPGMRALAVSRDLERQGLERGARVRIEGVEGQWIVLDRTHARLRRHVDLYFGNDVAAARTFGRRTVEITVLPPAESSPRTRGADEDGDDDFDD